MAERFFLDHGVWHDRETGQHLYTQDQYDAIQRQLLEAQETADNLARALRKEIEPPTFMGEPVANGVTRLDGKTESQHTPSA